MPRPTQELEMLAYARAWAPFGGPPAFDVFVLFGVSPRNFYDRVGQTILRTSSADTRSELDRRLLVLAAGHQHRGSVQRLSTR